VAASLVALGSPVGAEANERQTLARIEAVPSSDKTRSSRRVSVAATGLRSWGSAVGSRRESGGRERLGFTRRAAEALPSGETGDVPRPERAR
jgi:hypothetical protein